MDKAVVLIVSAAADVCRRFNSVLTQADYDVRVLDTCDAQAIATSIQGCDLLILDDALPHMSVAARLNHIKQQSPCPAVIVISEQDAVSCVVAAMQAGADDYVLKSATDELICAGVAGALQKIGRRASDTGLTDKRHRTIITCSAAMQQMLDTARRVAATTATILIQGESGTGKELVARFIHRHSGRADNPLVAMNCAALPENLAESELFGYEKGAFTGATQRKQGKFELAHNSTLLLDEIGEMPLALQAKLLRALQEKEVDRIGGQRPIPVHTRVIVTTNQDLGQMVKAETFREDLYYRLRVIPLTVPPLRARQEDIALLVAHFIEKYCPADRKPLPQFDTAALDRLMQWSWPGNVRELENTVHRAILISNGPLIGEQFLLLDQDLADGPTASAAALVGMTVKELEKKLIAQTLEHVNQNRTHAAEMLGISIRTLRNKLREYGEQAAFFPQAAHGR